MSERRSVGCACADGRIECGCLVLRAFYLYTGDEKGVLPVNYHLFEPVPADVREAMRAIIHGSWWDREEDAVLTWLEQRRKQREDDNQEAIARSAASH